MTTLREAAQQALECLKGVARGKYDGNAAGVCAALEAALAQQAEPVNVAGPARLAPKPAPGLEFDERGVLVPQQTEPVQGWTDADADAARLALELECLLTDKDVPLAAASRWWGSAHEALQLHRKRLADALAQQAEPAVDLPSLCSAIAKHLGESWLVVGPDGSRFVAPTPFRAASAANKHFGRLHHDPEKAAEFAAMIDKVRRDSERENDRLMAMYGSLNCPTCGGSGHIGDAASPAVQEQAEPDAYGYASRLAVAIWEKHYKDTAPQWKPLPDLLGVLTQIDNMAAGMARLAQQAEPVDPVAWECKAGGLKALTQRQYDAQPPNIRRHYTRIAPPQRKPLTDEEIERIFMTYQSPRQAARAIERAHGITDPQIADRLARHGIPMPEGDPK